jgi:hypothetical protein
MSEPVVLIAEFGVPTIAAAAANSRRYGRRAKETSLDEYNKVGI